MATAKDKQEVKKAGEKLVKKVLKLAHRHPKNAMRLGSHIVEHFPKEFELNEAELKELDSKGGKHWFKEAELPEKKKKKSAPALSDKL